MLDVSHLIVVDGWHFWPQAGESDVATELLIISSHYDGDTANTTCSTNVGFIVGPLR